ncbi:RHS repeat-associated core domain-containing protein [Pseudomonas frederiksbergensis]|uniref:RHS repeat-associated core domain-containing protein n=1 Tax=Pseudomonas frederiksbergensis TaxID=104087 RepID=UPI003D199EB4
MLQRWDQRGHHWQTRYDDQLRPVAIEEDAQPDVERFSYADSGADADHNLRGQLLEQVDSSGTLSFSSYDLLGQPLAQTRTFTGNSDTFTTRHLFSPLGSLLAHTDAGGHQQLSHYDLAGQLNQVSLQLAGATSSEPVLREAHYNATGQLSDQLAGNGVRSRWFYDPADGRLLRLLAQKDQEDPLQDMRYSYDPMGNVLRIDDPTFATVYFANQRVEGHRTFTYDSLYRLTESSGFEGDIPHLQPGLPSPIQPIDPGRRFNYTEHYQYDAANNLIELRHMRKGNMFTQEMRIDPHSNRGVRWKPGDAEPDFGEHFDPHGNQLKQQPGTLPLEWNSRDQLARVTLLKHSNGLPDDEETYRYSQGERVYKSSLTHTSTVTHRREVRYLPGLEIHDRSDGQQLHVIVLPGARCLHWVSGQPAGIEADQLRYSLDDHLGSCALELDRRADVISQEFYYAFGGTAWWATRSALEASYKTIRYSGKEMDASGLYYYGARYYAPWLQRWISADPAGDVDGLNLYAMVGNNPIIFTDTNGQTLGNFLDSFHETNEHRTARKNQSALARNQYRANMNLSKAIQRHTKILELTTRRAREAERQILNHQSATAHGGSAAIRTVAYMGVQAISYAAGIGIGTATAALGSVTGPVGVAFGIFLGIAAKKTVSMGLDFASERLSLGASVKFKAGKLDPNRIVARGEYRTMDYGPYVVNKFRGIARGVIELNKKGWLKGSKEAVTVGASIGMKAANTPFASEIGAVLSTVTGAFEILHEIAGAGVELSQEKIARADAHISGMIEVLNAGASELESLFDQAGRSSIHTYRPLSKIFGNAPGDTLESVRNATNATISQLRRTQTVLRAA